MAMVALTPTQRMEWLLEQRSLSSAHEKIQELLAQYERFLSTTNASEKELVERLLDRATGRSYMEAAYRFGDLVFEVLAAIGRGNRFHRLLVV